MTRKSDQKPTDTDGESDLFYDGSLVTHSNVFFFYTPRGVSEKEMLSWRLRLLSIFGEKKKERKGVGGKEEVVERREKVRSKSERG
jgi:hypothetical protein